MHIIEYLKGIKQITNHLSARIFTKSSFLLKRHSFLLFLIVTPTFLTAQDNDLDYKIDIQHWNVEDGLSHREIYTIYHDSRGFIWVGTQYGLNRFDGHQFKIFSKEKDGLASNEVFAIKEDSEGWLWVTSGLSLGTDLSIETHLTFVNIYTSEVQSIEKRFGKKFPINVRNLGNIIASDDGRIYFSGENKVYEYKDKTFKLLIESEAKLVVTDYNSKENTLLGYKVLSYNILYPSLIETFEYKNKYIATGKLQVSGIALFYDYTEKTWLVTNEGTYIRNKEKAWHKTDIKSLQPKLKNDEFNLIAIQKSGNIWQNNNDTDLTVFNPNTNFKIDISKRYPEILESNARNIHFDRNDNVWLTSPFGMYQLKIKKNPFKNYLNEKVADYNIITAFSCRGIGMMQGELWVNNTRIRQYLVDLQKNTYRDLSVSNKIAAESSDFEIASPYPIFEAADNELYTADHHLVQYKNGLPTKFYFWKKGTATFKSWSLFKDETRFWLGLEDEGLAIVKKDSIELYQDYNEFKTLTNSTGYHFYKWNDDNLLFATSNGIYVLNKNKGAVQRFWSGGKKGQNYIPADIIYHINRDKNNKSILWAATAGGGLLKLTLDKAGVNVKQTKQFTTIDGLTHNVTYAVYPDDYGNLWIPTDYGLTCFNTKTATCKGYTTTDGLPMNEFNRIAHYEAKDGRLFFGTINGLTSFYPKDLLGINETFDAPLQITDFNQFNGDKNRLENRTAELALNNKIVLQPKDKFLTISFALLEYNDANQIKYSYQLKGQSDDWVYLNNNELRLSGLPYGNLTLNVRAQGNSGQFSTQMLSIPITVKRPFYLTWWFWILIIAAIVVSFYFWYLNRTNALRNSKKELEQEVQKRTIKIENDKQIIENQAEELKNLDKLKSLFFANVSHELRTPLTLIVAPIQEMLAEPQLNEKTRLNLNLINKNSQRLQQMVNDILNLSKLEVGKMTLNTQAINWHVFIRQVFANFESFATLKGIDYQLNYQGREDIFVALDRNKMETVFNNLLSNAFKFTAIKDKITVNAGMTETQLWLNVQDTGRGISAEDLPNIFARYYQTKNKNQAAEGGTGIGLSLAKEMVILHKGSIDVESELGKGAIFKIQLPLEIVDEQELSLIEEEEADLIATETTELSTIEAIIPNHTQKSTILLVEDNLDLSAFIKSILEKHYNVITAANGEEALLELETDLPDLIISDIMMPIMDGFQLLEKLKSTPKYRQIPVIMLTARVALKDKLKALRIGVDDYLTKPFIKEELLVRIANLLRNAQSRKEALQLRAAEKTIVAPQDDTENGIENDAENEVENDAATQEWLDNLEQIILKNIAFSDFTNDSIAAEMFISKRQLYRKTKEYIGVTPLEYVKTYKLNYARELLETQKVTSVKAAAYSIGYPNLIYFRRAFKKAFGRLPSDFLS